MLHKKVQLPGADQKIHPEGCANPCGWRLPNILIKFSGKPYEILARKGHAASAPPSPLDPPPNLHCYSPTKFIFRLHTLQMI